MNQKLSGRKDPDKSEQLPQVKGIRISRMNAAIIVITCVLSILMIATAYYVSKTLHKTYIAISDFAVCTQTEHSFIEASDYLTEQVRLYTVTCH